MTQAEKKMKNYVNAVERRLNLPREIKARVMSDFQSSIVARREAGQTDEEIYAELGTPAKAAADLNEQMKDYTYRKSPWRFLFLGIAAIGGVRLLYDGFVSLIGYVVLRRELVQSGRGGHRHHRRRGRPHGHFCHHPRLDKTGVDGGAAYHRRGGISAAAAVQGEIKINLAENINVCYNIAHVLCNFPKEVTLWI